MIILKIFLNINDKDSHLFMDLFMLKNKMNIVSLCTQDGVQYL